MRTLIAVILCLLLIILVITMVLRSVERKPTGAVKVPVLFKYHLRRNQDLTTYGYFSDNLNVEAEFSHYAGDTLMFTTTEKHLISEHRNLVNAVTGKVECENVALISEEVKYR